MQSYYCFNFPLNLRTFCGMFFFVVFCIYVCDLWNYRSLQAMRRGKENWILCCSCSTWFVFKRLQCYFRVCDIHICKVLSFLVCFFLYKTETQSTHQKIKYTSLNWARRFLQRKFHQPILISYHTSLIYRVAFCECERARVFSVFVTYSFFNGLHWLFVCPSTDQRSLVHCWQ